MQQLFTVTITEVLERTITVPADSVDEAEEVVAFNYRNGDIILDASDFTDVNFVAVPVDLAKSI